MRHRRSSRERPSWTSRGSRPRPQSCGGPWPAGGSAQRRRLWWPCGSKSRGPCCGGGGSVERCASASSYPVLQKIFGCSAAGATPIQEQDARPHFMRLHSLRPYTHTRTHSAATPEYTGVHIVEQTFPCSRFRTLHLSWKHFSRHSQIFTNSGANAYGFAFLRFFAC